MDQERAVYGAPSVEKMLGALPVVADFCRRLGIRELVDAACPVREVFGIPTEALNDDRIARALDAIVPQLDHITGSVGLAAIAAFGLDVTRRHSDMTSMSPYGAYPDLDEQYPAPRFASPQGPAPGPEADPDRAGSLR